LITAPLRASLLKKRSFDFRVSDPESGIVLGSAILHPPMLE
jgi:hypothetical protein